MAQIGGCDVKDTVRRIMKTVLSHDMSLKYNWAGKTGWKSKSGFVKKAFSHLNLCSVITGKC